MVVLTPNQRSRAMRAIKSKDTSIELKVRKRLWNMGYRYRKNYRFLPGCPDIVFIKKKIVIFCDSEFWHGKDFDENSFSRTQNRDFWIKKIRKNIDRDIKVNDELVKMGYKVIRIWGKDINKGLDQCIEKIQSEIDQESK
jgi:DNA mismatch endonuclease, patch repair protein